jgi:hypothetical protein
MSWVLRPRLLQGVKGAYQVIGYGNGPHQVDSHAADLGASPPHQYSQDVLVSVALIDRGLQTAGKEWMAAHTFLLPYGE